MIEFEKFLLEKGFTKYCYDVKTKKYYKPKRHTISTMTNLDHRYTQKDYGDNVDKIGKQIIIGLYEYGYGIQLISPRLFDENGEELMGHKLNNYLYETDNEQLLQQLIPLMK